MDLSVEKKLKELWKLQQIDTQLDNIRLLMGELPMEVSDLEDDIAGLQTRVTNIEEEIGALERDIVGYKNNIKDFRKTIEKADEHLNNIKNSREFDALSKEKEIAELEILTAEKRIKDTGKLIDAKKEVLDSTKANVDSRKKDLEFKKGELSEIEKENDEEIQKVNTERAKASEIVDSRLLRAYERIRANMRNGVSVAPIIRGSCGGCFSKVPPQRQSDIRAHFRIIDCENCGRILVDSSITGIEANVEPKEEKPTRRRKLGAKAE